jgi:hypothetical protein
MSVSKKKQHCTKSKYIIFVSEQHCTKSRSTVLVSELSYQPMLKPKTQYGFHELILKSINIKCMFMNKPFTIQFRLVGFMVLYVTFSNTCISIISWWSILLVKETREPGENH